MARTPIPETRWPTAKEAAQSLLMRPIRIGPSWSRTRTWVPAMVPWRATEEGFVTDAVLEWYGRFADGGPGVLVVEATGIRDVPSGPLLRAGHDRFLPGLKKLTDTVRRRSGGRTRTFLQIIDFLRIRRRPEPAKFVTRFLDLRDVHRQRFVEQGGNEAVAECSDEEFRQVLLGLPHESLLALLDPREVEDLEFGARERVSDIDLAHVAELPAVLPGLFAAAAWRARRAGFDGVELHFAHAYTMASFLSRLNDRTDGYGGSPEARVRLPVEVVAAVRAEVGRDWVVGCRFLGDEVIEGGSRVDDAAYYAERLARAGLDFLSVSKGGKFEDAKRPRVGHSAYPYTGESGHECMPTVRIGGPGPFGRNLPLSHAVRARVRECGFETPVVGAGGINTFDIAESALRSGDCDLVGAARQTLADPDWFRKIELGRGSEVRRCVYTNYCEALDQRHLEVTCQLWDRELEDPDAGGSAASMAADGRRRLVPPPWVSEVAPGSTTE